MKNKPKRKFAFHYRKWTFHLALIFTATVIALVFVIALIMLLLDKLGLRPHGTMSPVFFSFLLYTLCLVLASATAYFVAWNIFKPLRDISEASKKIAKGEYDVELNYKSHARELNNTIENFNYMAQELRSVEMIRNDFIANVSHEFKTPLSSLTGYLTLLQDGSLSDSERNEYISKAFFSIEKLNDLTDNILRLSKLENQQNLDAPVSYRLDEQLREAIVLLEPKWSRKNTDFELILPEITYSGQKALLFQVWTNIISNAIKFSHESGRITIKLEQTEHHCNVYISDEGIGMTEEQQRHIFDKFYQADSSRQAQGNGLGLALCKEILARCGGKIYVTSKPNEGSVFLVSLKKQPLP